MESSTAEKGEVKDVLVPKPRPDVFDAKHAIEHEIVSPGAWFFLLEKVEYPPEGGIYVHYKGMSHPKKGFPFPEATWQNDVMKRITMTFLETAAAPALILPFLVFALMPWRMKMSALETAINNYSRVSEWLMGSMFLKPERYSNPVRSLRKIMEAIIADMGISGSGAYNAIKAIATIFEYDDAYRYRLQDMFTATSKEALISRPIREARRLISLFESRERIPKIQAKIKIIRMAMTAVLLHPRIRRALRKAISDMSDKDMAWLTLDNDDRYHCLLFTDYDFLGVSAKDRLNMFVDAHTFSDCCDAGVLETKYEKGWQTTCKKCGKPCKWEQRLPPQYVVNKDGLQNGGGRDTIDAQRP